MGRYSEFKNLCFVDTLDNVAGLNETVSGIHSKYKVLGDLFAVTTENSQRIIDQNRKKISVIIGNPPYNANQANENDNNKNRLYTVIDKRIKDTFIKQSTAQKTKVYDMYARFYRWAFDRLDNNGVIAFVTNRSFIDKRTFDGFRKTIHQEFDYAYIIDTKSDVRDNPKIAGTTHNIFGIQTGVAIMFLIKRIKPDNSSCKIHYATLDDFWKKEQKLEWLSQNPLRQISFDVIRPDKKNNWLNMVDNDFESLMPLVSKGAIKKTLFEQYGMGISTNRDEWVYDVNRETLKEKVQFFINTYSKLIVEKDTSFPGVIKWSRDLKNKFSKEKGITYDESLLIECAYRPYFKTNFYASKIVVDLLTDNHLELLTKTFDKPNTIIAVNYTSSKDFNVLGTRFLMDLHYNGDTSYLSLYRYNSSGLRIDNITQWAVNRFVDEYGRKGIDRENIFFYVYAVLHNPSYRNKYKLNLKRDFPRIPFYQDFKQWAQWGKQLMDLHINYETVEPYLLNVHDIDIEPNPKPKLKADKEKGIIAIDENTLLEGIPKEAWMYKLGNRSALEWILDQYKESKPKDPTIAEKFNTYKFADYKEQVIDLLKRVCTVSVKTMEIVTAMETVNEQAAVA
jgi:predicted helicase